MSDRETYTQFSDRLKGYLLKWVELSKCDQSFDGLVELMLLEQLRTLMTTKLKTFLAENGVDSLDRSIELADRYVAAHRDENTHSPTHNSGNRHKNNDRRNNAHQDRNQPAYPDTLPHYAHQGTRPHHQTNGGGHRPAPTPLLPQGRNRGAPPAAHTG